MKRSPEYQRRYAELRRKAWPISVLEDEAYRKELAAAHVVFGLDSRRKTFHLFYGADVLHLDTDDAEGP
jgi:hypothetical protein